MGDAIRDQLIDQLDSRVLWLLTEDEWEGLFDLIGSDRAVELAEAITTRVVEVLPNLRDSDGIPLVLGLIAERLESEFLSEYQWALLDEATVWLVPRLSEDRPHE